MGLCRMAYVCVLMLMLGCSRVPHVEERIVSPNRDSSIVIEKWPGGGVTVAESEKVRIEGKASGDVFALKGSAHAFPGWIDERRVLICYVIGGEQTTGFDRGYIRMQEGAAGHVLVEYVRRPDKAQCLKALEPLTR